jgi:hypothetical protein
MALTRLEAGDGLVVAIDPVALVQPLPECLENRRRLRGRRWGNKMEKCDPRDWCWPLRVGRERHHELAEGEADEEPNQARRHRGVLQEVEPDHRPEGV